MEAKKITPEMAGAAVTPPQIIRPATGLSAVQITKLKFKMLAAARGVCPDFRVTEENRRAIAAVFDWCMMLGELTDPTKGLWLHGDIGTGKSTLLKVVQVFAPRVRTADADGLEYGFRITPCITVASDFNSEGYAGLDEYTNRNRQAFDDLGTEPCKVNYYGSTVNPMQHVLMARYDRRGYDMTHVTTNLQLDEVAAIYGDRVFDRCHEMFNFIELNGYSMRD